MAGYWPSCVVYEPRRSRSPKTRKKRMRPISSHLGRTRLVNLIKNLLCGFWENIVYGTRRVVSSGQDSSILPARVVNHSAGFDSSCVPASGNKVYPCS